MYTSESMGTNEVRSGGPGSGAETREDEQTRDFYINLINYKLRDKTFSELYLVHVVSGAFSFSRLGKLTDLRRLELKRVAVGRRQGGRTSSRSDMSE